MQHPDGPVTLTVCPTTLVSSAPSVADDSGIDIGCWSIVRHSGPISGSADIDAFFEQTAVRPPEMVFLANHLTIAHTPTGAAFSFNTRDALRGCLLDRSKHVDQPPAPDSPARDDIRVTHARQWKGKEHDVNVQTLNLAYDWTYTTHYRATLTPPPPPHTVTATEHTAPLPLRLLQRPDPILWYCQLPLYEDELHDNGVCSVSVKARVMASCWLVLMQCWLRVDDVCVKVYETRLYCEQMAGDRVEVIREWQAREETFESLAARGLPRDSKSYTDPVFVARKLPVVAQTRELITLQP